MENEPQLFLIDTGSAYSFLKPKYKHKVTAKADKEFLAVNASPITMYGIVNLKLELGSFHFDQKFHVAEVENNIIGNDFLVANKILINVGEKILAWQNQETCRIESFSINGIIPRKNYHRLPIIFKKSKGTNTKMVETTDTNKNMVIKREPSPSLPRRDNTRCGENNKLQKNDQETILVKNRHNFKGGETLFKKISEKLPQKSNIKQLSWQPRLASDSEENIEKTSTV